MAVHISKFVQFTWPFGRVDMIVSRWGPGEYRASIPYTTGLTKVLVFVDRVFIGAQVHPYGDAVNHVEIRTYTPDPDEMTAAMSAVTSRQARYD